MRYKHFEKANLDVSELAVGTWAIGINKDPSNDQKAIEAIQTMIDGGVNLIDTAPAYGLGHAEKIVSEAIKKYDRSKILISTKAGVNYTTLKGKKGSNLKIPHDSSFGNILYECECSLRRLGTDYIDFFFVHWPDPETPFAETAQALNILKNEGKIRHICLSNFMEEQIEEMSKYCDVDVIQESYSMVDRRMENLLKFCHQNNYNTFTYGSLGAGILTGKFRQLTTFPEGDPRNTFYRYFKEPGFSQVMEVLKVMDEIALEINKPLGEIALNWTVAKEFVSTTLCGVKTKEQALSNLKAFDWQLDAKYVKVIDEAVEKYINYDASPIRN